MWRSLVPLGFGGIAIAAGCGSSVSNAPPDTLGGFGDGGAYDAGQVVGSGGGGGIPLPVDGGGIGSLLGDASLDGAPAALSQPLTCDQAAQAHSYIGCDYWPTVVSNNVWSIFDFAVVVANAGQSTASVTVTGPFNTKQTATVPPGQLAKLYLPWVPALKGADSDNCGAAVPLVSSVKVTAGAFHLTSSAPVTVYQFNALEYVGGGGPPGKSWSSCPGNTACVPPPPSRAFPIGCYSFSNDASLLLPRTAMTGNYRVAGHEGSVLVDPATGGMGEIGGYMAITATKDATTVNVKVSPTGAINGGTGIPATSAGGVLTLALNAGDVAELVGPGASDLSGSLVQASAQVQVITGMPCIDIPPNAPACDHIEESVFPAETLGKDYVVTRPAGPNGDVVAHQVRIYGNVDATHLTYNPVQPLGCPSVINAGQVVECGVACPPIIDVTQTYDCGTVSQDFEVKGDQPFSVGIFTLGASVVDPATQAPNQKGDPAQSFATAVEQFRAKYVFLAPDDYPVSYVDIVGKPGTTITLDGQSVPVAPQAIGTSAYAVFRVKLGPGQAGAHVLVASQQVGIQVIGYGAYTSYMYPGGLDLANIAPPPPRIQ